MVEETYPSRQRFACKAPHAQAPSAPQGMRPLRLVILCCSPGEFMPPRASFLMQRAAPSCHCTRAVPNGVCNCSPAKREFLARRAQCRKLSVAVRRQVDQILKLTSAGFAAQTLRTEREPHRLTVAKVWAIMVTNGVSGRVASFIAPVSSSPVWWSVPLPPFHPP
jgi:hypothetical protein